MPWRTTLAVLVAALLAACGPGDPPEQRLREAERRADEARQAVARAKAELEKEREQLEQCRQDLHGAQQQLGTARERRSDAEQEVDQQATDVAVFRYVQRALLEDDALKGAAITAHVEDGIVELTGEAETAAQRDRAKEVAAGAPGVRSVESSIQVLDGTDADSP